MEAFKSFIVSEENGTYVGKIDVVDTASLKHGDVLIKVMYSSLNYIDALAFAGDKALYSKYPITPGIDVAGVVVESSSPSFKEGDEVLATGAGIGITSAGGFGGYVRTSATNIISLPTGLSLKEAMILGTEGLASAIAVANLKAFTGIKPGSEKPILVTGAKYGTGLFAARILVNLGYIVDAVSYDNEACDFLKDVGVRHLLTAQEFVSSCDRSYEAVIDTIGGDVLSKAISLLEYAGTAVVCGYNPVAKFSSPTSPFALKGINLLGVDAVNCDIKTKANAWNMLSGDWFMKALPLFGSEISMSEIPEYAKRILAYDIKGRVVINHAL